MPTRHRILVVEDEPSLRTGIVDLLAFKGHAPEGVGTGTDGLKRALEADFSLIVLDLMLPGLNGLEVCRQVREAKPAQPILLLTAKGREEDILAGFEAGCDDYVTKPMRCSNEATLHTGRRPQPAYTERRAKGRASMQKQRHGKCAKSPLRIHPHCVSTAPPTLHAHCLPVALARLGRVD